MFNKINKYYIFFRGFEFNTTLTSAYPYHLLEKDSNKKSNHSTFDYPQRRKLKTLQMAVALPKTITRGTLTIHEHFKKNESKILLHKR